MAGGFLLSNARHTGHARLLVCLASEIAIIPSACLAGIAGDAGYIGGRRGWKFFHIADFHFEQLVNGWSTECHFNLSNSARAFFAFRITPRYDARLFFSPSGPQKSEASCCNSASTTARSRLFSRHATHRGRAH